MKDGAPWDGDLPGEDIHVIAAECIGIRLMPLLRGSVYFARLRSDELLRCLAGKPSPAPEPYFSRYRSFHWAGTARPSLAGHQIRSFWMTNFSDDVLNYYMVNGAVVSPVFHRSHEDYASEWGHFRRKHRRLPCLTLHERAANWRTIDRILKKLHPAAQKVAVFYDTSRLANETFKAALTESEEAMRKTLYPLGWSCFALPPDIPPDELGNYWAHYDKKALRNFFMNCIRDAGIAP